MVYSAKERDFVIRLKKETDKKANLESILPTIVSDCAMNALVGNKVPISSFQQKKRTYDETIT